MAKFRVTDPEGKAVIVEANTPEEAVTKSRTHSAGFNWGAFADTVKDTPRYLKMAGRSIAHGVMDPIVGAGQLASKVMPQAAENRFADYMRQRDADYSAKRSGYENQPDVGRIAGNVVPGLLTGGTAAPASLGGRMLEGARIGGILGSTAPVDPSAESYWAQKGAQTGVGAAGGLLAPPVVEGVIRGAASTVNALGRAFRGVNNSISGQASTQTIETTLQAEFQRNGVDWSKMAQEARAGIIGEVQRALKAGGQIDHKAVARLAQFEKAGVTPTSGQVTRDPNQFALERNLGKMEIGAPLAQRFDEQNASLIGALDQTRQRTGASGVDPYESGKRVIGALQSRDAGRKAAVDQAYQTARNSAGLEADVPLQPIAQKYLQLVEDFGDDRIPRAVMKRLNEFGLAGGTQTKVFNIREAEKLKTLIDNNIDAPGTPVSKAMGELKRTVDDAINSLADKGDVIGAETAGAFKNARLLARDRFGKIDQNPALSAALDKTSLPIAPEKFIEKYVIRGDIDRVASLMREIPVQARSEARAAVIDWIRQKAVPSAGGDTAQLTQGGLNKALGAIGERKLRLIFAGDKEGREMLKALADVSSYIQKPPVSSGVNTSGSATTLLDAMDKATRVPFIGPLLGKPGDILRLNQVSKATGPVAPVLTMEPVIPEGLLTKWAPRAGLLSAPVAGALPFALSR